ncbi:MAG: aspartate carbamoyltransferase regulatory subunit [Bacteroidales bacterium]|nr:aspartate carbamoyltransferase regulatory subunit [Bacteroidales bacterium]MBQ7985481.1 aspartate carbamoyltransferase regulatory subunit [Bacteroidales bacterium]
MTTNNKELVVEKIDNGTVIDHIPADRVFKIVKILGLDTYEDEVLIGTNLCSKKYGKKGILKIKNKYFTQDETDKIAIIAPTATIIVIKDYEVTEKKNLVLPKHITKIVKCINPNCITNVEEIETNFDVVNTDPISIQCHYCEKTMEEIIFNE